MKAFRLIGTMQQVKDFLDGFMYGLESESLLLKDLLKDKAV